MIRRVAFFSIFAFLLFAADPAEAVRQVAVGWTQAAVKHSHANGRTQTKAEYIAAVTKGPARYESFDFSDMKISIYGKTAVLTAYCDVKMTGAPSFRVRTQHVYVENNGRWQFAAHLSTRVNP